MKEIDLQHNRDQSARATFRGIEGSHTEAAKAARDFIITATQEINPRAPYRIKTVVIKNATGGFDVETEVSCVTARAPDKTDLGAAIKAALTKQARTRGVVTKQSLPDVVRQKAPARQAKKTRPAPQPEPPKEPK